MKRYTITGLHKTAELDNFEQGCSGKPHRSYIKFDINCANVKILVEEIQRAFGCELLRDQIDGENNRLDFQCVENDCGDIASKRELALFKNHEIDLWLCNYSVYVSISEAADLTEFYKGLANDHFPD